MAQWIRLPSDNNDYLNLSSRKKKQLLKVIGPPHTKWHVCTHKHIDTHTNTQYMKNIYTQDMREGSLYGGNEVFLIAVFCLFFETSFRCIALTGLKRSM